MSTEFKKAEDKKQCPNVLVVDDEINVCRAISFILREEFNVTIVETGEKAIQLIRKDTGFDVVSLDLFMPGMSGIETLKAIKEHDPTVEILIVTAHSDYESARDALRSGAYDYIEKPFKQDAFREAIRRGVVRRAKILASEKAKEKLQFVKAQLIESEKFAELGRLIAGVAHELNNPLSVIMGYSEFLIMNSKSAKESVEYARKINESAKLCNEIIQNLLTFSRRREKKREYVQLNRVIESTLKLKQHDFKIDGIKFVKKLADNMPDVYANFYELQQVFLNIINNADHAMQEEPGNKTLIVTSDFDDNVVRIYFQDTGPGIPKKNFQKIFEPLFTTKAEGKGTGLGLSICYDIIKEHDGNIYVASDPDGGATFILEIPILSDKSA